MKALVLALIMSATFFAAEGQAQACDRNKIDNNTMLSNNKNNYYTVMKSKQATPSAAMQSVGTGSRRH